MAHNELLNAWLKDAYGMETALIPVLQQHAKDAKDFPEVAARDELHIEETKRHAELVKSCIERRGESISTVKTAIGGVVGAVQSVATAPFKDEPVKNFLSDYAAEKFETICYQALIVAAQNEGDHETARVCQQILAEDEAMAKWLEDHLPSVVTMAMRMKEIEHSKVK